MTSRKSNYLQSILIIYGLFFFFLPYLDLMRNHTGIFWIQHLFSVMSKPIFIIKLIGHIKTFDYFFYSFWSPHRQFPFSSLNPGSKVSFPQVTNMIRMIMT